MNEFETAEVNEPSLFEPLQFVSRRAKSNSSLNIEVKLKLTDFFSAEIT